MSDSQMLNIIKQRTVAVAESQSYLFLSIVSGCLSTGLEQTPIKVSTHLELS